MIVIYIRPLVMALLVAFAATKTAVAHEIPQSYDRISFQVSAVEEVENDTLVAVMYSERSGQKPSMIADEVNSNISWAVDLAKKNSAVRVQTLHYRQDPLYKNQSIIGWKIRQSIRLESTEAASLSALIGELQGRLSVASLSYTVSPTRRSEVEHRLIADALNRFKSRGEQIQVELGRTDYRIVNMDVITSGQSFAPVRMRASAMMEDSGVAAPSIEPGVQTVSVQVSGTIELNIPQ
jgi:predicted secreted protein